MDSTTLYELFRSDVADEAQPYLWKETEVWAYMDSAYKTFARLVGGFPDFTSSVTQIDASAGEPTTEISKKIMRVMSARRADGRELSVINAADLGRGGCAYSLTDHTGPLTAMVIGMQRGLVRWINVPELDETVSLHVYRLPLGDITGEGQEFDDLDEQHHIYLLNGMKALAYRKQDAETFDKERAEENEAVFYRYCQQVRGEFEREKHKTRVVGYGGI